MPNASPARARSLWLAALVLAASLAWVTPSAPATSTTSTIAYFPLSGSELSAAQANGLVVTEDYGGFIVGTVTSAGRAWLDANHGVYHDVEYAIGRGGYAYDPLQGSPIPADWKNSATTLRLLQFVGPIKPSWEDSASGTGALVLGRLTPSTLLVEATGSSLASLGSLSHLRWTGPYHPGMRVAAQLMNASFVGEVIVVSHQGRAIAALETAAAVAGCTKTVSWSDPTGPRMRCVGDATAVRNLAFSDSVAWVEPYAGPAITNSQYASGIVQSGTIEGKPFYDAGIFGTGQTIGVVDTGLRMAPDGDAMHVAFLDPQVTAITFNQALVHRKIAAYLNPTHEGVTYGDQDDVGTGAGESTAGHGTMMAGILAGDAAGTEGYGDAGADDGIAPGAKLVVVDVHVAHEKDLRGPADEGVTLGTAYSASDTRIISNSRGTRGIPLSGDVDPLRSPALLWPYPETARQIDAFAESHPDAVLVYSAGNQGTTYLNHEAQAKNILAVGAIRSPSEVDPHASIGELSMTTGSGPVTDGRIKPDLLAPGNLVKAPKPGTVDEYLHDFGTSQAAAVTAGSLALLRQYYVDGWYPTGTPQEVNRLSSPSAPLLRTVTLATTVPIPDSDAYYDSARVWPNHFQGWGRMLLGPAAYFEGDAARLLSLTTTALPLGQPWDNSFVVESSAEPLHIALGWNDCPGQPGARIALCSDAQLIVSAPDGQVYLGNNFATEGTHSLPGGALDLRNVVEMVRVPSPMVGTWKVHVVAEGRISSLALAVTGDIDHVSLNRAPYDTTSPTGPTSVTGGTTQTYTFQTSGDRDEGRPVRAQIDWGDGTGSVSSYVDASPENPLTLEASHKFNRDGTFAVRSRAVDEQGATSPWSAPLYVTSTCTPTSCLTSGGGGGGGDCLPEIRTMDSRTASRSYTFTEMNSCV